MFVDIVAASMESRPLDTVALCLFLPNINSLKLLCCNINTAYC